MKPKEKCKSTDDMKSSLNKDKLNEEFFTLIINECATDKYFKSRLAIEIANFYRSQSSVLKNEYNKEFTKAFINLSDYVEFSYADELESEEIISEIHIKRPYDITDKFGKESVKNSDTLEILKKLTEKIETYNQEIKKIKNDSIKLKEIIYKDSSSFGSDSKIQTIPIDIYLDTEDSAIIFGIYESVLAFIDSIGFEKTFEFIAVKGSWFKRMVANSKEAITSDDVINRFKEVEYGVEVNTILKQQSEIDKNQSEALLNILKSVENVSNAAIRIGSLLVVKIKNAEGEVNVQVRSLSIKELHLLNKRPELLHNPQLILTALTTELRSESEFPPTSKN